MNGHTTPEPAPLIESEGTELGWGVEQLPAPATVVLPMSTAGGLNENGARRSSSGSGGPVDLSLRGTVDTEAGRGAASADGSLRGIADARLARAFSGGDSLESKPECRRDSHTSLIESFPLPVTNGSFITGRGQMGSGNGLGSSFGKNSVDSSGELGRHFRSKYSELYTLNPEP